MADFSATTGTWVIDQSHTTIGFTVRHAMIAKVRGEFADFSGSMTLDGANPANSTAELVVQTASISTGNPDRDGHLKSPDFLDVEKFPTLAFTSTGVRSGLECGPGNRRRSRQRRSQDHPGC